MAVLPSGRMSMRTARQDINSPAFMLRMLLPSACKPRGAAAAAYRLARHEEEDDDSDGDGAAGSGRVSAPPPLLPLWGGGGHGACGKGFASADASDAAQRDSGEGEARVSKDDLDQHETGRCNQKVGPFRPGSTCSL